jgi:hypothetical protein
MKNPERVQYICMLMVVNVLLQGAIVFGLHLI